MNEPQRDAWTNKLVGETLDKDWYDVHPDARYVADAAALKVSDAQQDAMGLLRLVGKLREAAGDPTGKLMQPELIARIQEMREERDALAAQLEERNQAAINLQATLAKANALFSDATNGALVYEDGCRMGRVVSWHWLEKSDEIMTAPYGEDLVRLKAQWQADAMDWVMSKELNEESYGTRWRTKVVLPEIDRLREIAEGKSP